MPIDSSISFALWCRRSQYWSINFYFYDFQTFADADRCLDYGSRIGASAQHPCRQVDDIGAKASQRRVPPTSRYWHCSARSAHQGHGHLWHVLPCRVPATMGCTRSSCGPDYPSAHVRDLYDALKSSAHLFWPNDVLRKEAWNASLFRIHWVSLPGLQEPIGLLS